MKRIVPFLLMLLISTISAVFIGDVIGVNPVYPLAVLVGASFLPISPVGSLMAYVAVNVNRPSGMAPGGGGDKKDKLILILKDEVASLPARDASGIKITGNIVMNSGKKMFTLYVDTSQLKAAFTTEGEMDGRKIKQLIECRTPSYSLEVAEFIQNNLNSDFYVIIQKCSDSTMILYGAECAPLQINPSGDDNSEGNYTSINFESKNKGPAPAIYEGTLDILDDSGSGA